jgi:Tfp pilus assembly protein PilO
MNGTDWTKMVLAHRLVFTMLAAFFVLNGLVYGVLSSTQEKQIKSLRASYQHLRSLKNSSNENSSDPYQKARKEIDRFYETLEISSGFMEMVVALKNQVNDFGLHIRKMNFKPEPMENPSVIQYKTHLVVSGEYRRLKQLMAALTRSSRRICIETLVFQDHSDEEEMVDMEIIFSTYYREKK